jgi:hypothetical protein
MATLFDLSPKSNRAPHRTPGDGCRRAEGWNGRWNFGGARDAARLDQSQ